jgi:RNA polymerase sigma-70 factor (ECF subfamily)
MMSAMDVRERRDKGSAAERRPPPVRQRRDPDVGHYAPPNSGTMPDPGIDHEDLGEIVRRAQAGDEEAFRVVYRAIQPGLLRYLRVLVGDDAEDVASEAWGQIARDLQSFSGDGNGFRGWAATIGRHRALDHVRWLRRRPVAAAGIDSLADEPGPDDTERLALDGVSTDRAIALIATLPPDQAEAVLLRVVVGLDAETAAGVLGKRAGAVRTAAHRGLRRLAELLDHADPQQRGFNA